MIEMWGGGNKMEKRIVMVFKVEKLGKRTGGWNVRLYKGYKKANINGEKTG